MSPFPRKSPEERAAEKAERARQDAAREEAAIRAHAAEVERTARARAAARAAEEQLVNTLPKWEYKVLTSTALAGFGDGRPEQLEPMLNAYAAHGWRVIAMSFTGQISQAFATDKNHVYVVLERPARGGGHAGAPVQPLPEPPHQV